MNKLRIVVAGSLAFLLFAGCNKDTSPGGTKTVSLVNEWWVTLKLGGVDELGTPVAFYTYNTSANDDSLWLDDLKNGYGFRSRVKADLSNLTFSATNALNDYDVNTVTITGGKIIPNGSRSATGVVTDSIYMEANFSDDPADTFIISGTARTRWPADDY